MRWLLLLLLGVLAGGCEAKASAAAPSSPPQQQPTPSRAPAVPPTPTPPPTWEGRRRRRRADPSPRSDAELARQAALRAQVLDEAAREVTRLERTALQDVKPPPSSPVMDWAYSVLDDDPDEDRDDDEAPELDLADVAEDAAEDAADEAVAELDQVDDDEPPELEPADPSVPELEDTGPVKVPTSRDIGESLAAAVVHSLEQHGTGYDRGAVKDLQRHAGLVVDGIYGPGTAGAVRYFTGAKPPPHHLRTNVKEKPYVPRH